MLAPLFRFFWRVKVYGAENVPEDNGVMFCANHMAARDPIIIAASCKRPITFLGKKELFKVPLLGWLIKKLGAIPLDRGGKDIGAIKTSVDVLKNGGALAIFPQGHRYPGENPATTPTKNGAALISYRSGCDIVPVCIKTKGYKYRFLGRIEVVFGKPIKNSELGFVNGGTDEYKAATDKIVGEVLKLGGYEKPNTETTA